jgi:hypothetical protein
MAKVLEPYLTEDVLAEIGPGRREMHSKRANES